MTKADIKTTPLTPTFGVEVSGVALADFVPSGRFDELRALFEEHSALLFRMSGVSAHGTDRGD